MFAQKSFRLYGSEVSDATVTYFERCQFFLVSVCACGTVLQVVQVAAPDALEFAAAFVYLVYNVTAMLIVRVANVGFKFENQRCLAITVRIAAAMAIYGIVVFFTVLTFDSDAALLLMGIFGLVNVLIILPTNIYEDSMMLTARSNNVGLEKAQPLTCCENLIVVAFLVLANLIIIAVILVNIAILAGASLWPVLTGLYVAMNLIPAVLPKVEHLVSTETRVWPLKILLLHFALVVVSVIITAVSLTVKTPSRQVSRLFGAIGVLNGVIVATRVPGFTLFCFARQAAAACDLLHSGLGVSLRDGASCPVQATYPSEYSRPNHRKGR